MRVLLVQPRRAQHVPQPHPRPHCGGADGRQERRVSAALRLADRAALRQALHSARLWPAPLRIDCPQAAAAHPPSRHAPAVEMEPPSHSRPLTGRPASLYSLRRLPVHCAATNGRRAVRSGRGGRWRLAPDQPPSRQVQSPDALTRARTHLHRGHDGVRLEAGLQLLQAQLHLQGGVKSTCTQWDALNVTPVAGTRTQARLHLQGRAMALMRCSEDPQKRAAGSRVQPVRAAPHGMQRRGHAAAALAKHHQVPRPLPAHRAQALALHPQPVVLRLDVRHRQVVAHLPMGGGSRRQRVRKAAPLLRGTGRWLRTCAAAAGGSEGHTRSRGSGPCGRGRAPARRSGVCAHKQRRLARSAA